MKYSIFSISLLLTSSVFASQVSDTMRAQYAPGPKLNVETAAQKGGSTLATQQGGSTLAQKGRGVMTSSTGNVVVSLPAELQKLVTPAMEKDPAFADFILSHDKLWAEKKALLEKNPQLKELAKKHVQLKLQLLKLKEKSPEYKKFFEEAFKYWINKMNAELK